MYKTLRIIPLQSDDVIPVGAVDEETARKILADVERGGKDIPEAWKVEAFDNYESGYSMIRRKPRMIVFESTRRVERIPGRGIKPVYDCITWDPSERVWCSIRAVPFNESGMPYKHAVGVYRVM